MGRTNKPILSQEEQAALEKMLKTSDNHSFRKRCQLVLLKAAGRTSIDVGKIVGMNPVSVNSWLNRYKSDKIKGLLVKAGRGRKALINKESDTPLILETVKSNRQRLQTAKAEWESLSGKTVSGSTFKRFLKALLGRHSAADTNG